ncbi:MAG TPA: hypothetical protein VKB60_12805, partial [Terriglobales bacterium]|nr:hypothetical protein [Terriglobales bacterium]
MMSEVKRVILLAASLLVLAFSVGGFPATARAQEPNEQMLLHPPANSWPSYHGDYSGRRHSSLVQITPKNVKSL